MKVIGDIFDRFSDEAVVCVRRAFEESWRIREMNVSVYMLILGILREPKGPAYTVLLHQGLDLENARTRIANLYDTRTANAIEGLSFDSFFEDAEMSPAFKRVLEHAVDSCNQRTDSKITSAHLLIGIVELNGQEICSKLGIDFESVKKELDLAS